MKRITILGSTGSIGRNTLDLIATHSNEFEVIALSAKTQIDVLFSQCRAFVPKFAVVENELDAQCLQEKIRAAKLTTQVLFGSQALCDVAALSEVDYVMAAIVGSAGLLPTLAAVNAGKKVLLANKEALVMSGALFMSAVAKSGACLIPIDSEHNAIFQSMPSNYTVGTKAEGVEKIILTASGGPFRQLPLTKFAQITPEQAIAHPNWKMGAKISIDSATMMNKGLEVIEAFWLFKMDIAQIEVVIHPQSIIHSLVSYEDGSFLAQLGAPDMRIPIAHALAWPKRFATSVARLNLVDVGKLTFESVDYERFPCLDLAYYALKAGGTAATILNAANEVAVTTFLKGCIRYLDIAPLVTAVLEKIPTQRADSLDVILEADNSARKIAEEMIETSFACQKS